MDEARSSEWVELRADGSLLDAIGYHDGKSTAFYRSPLVVFFNSPP